MHTFVLCEVAWRMYLTSGVTTSKEFLQPKLTKELSTSQVKRFRGFRILILVAEALCIVMQISCTVVTIANQLQLVNLAIKNDLLT